MEEEFGKRREDVEARLDRLILTAAALDGLTGDAWNTVDERLRFLVARVAAWAGHEPQLTRSTLCTEGPARLAVLALPCHPGFADAHALGGVRPASQVGDEWEMIMVW